MIPQAGGGDDANEASEAMTASEVEKLNREHEKRIRRTILWAYGLCLCAVIPPLFLILGIFRPQPELFGQWFARSGAVMSAIAVVAQFKASGIATMIRGSTFGESWGFYRKYSRLQAFVDGLSLALVVTGTIVWGFGDLLFPLPHV